MKKYATQNLLRFIFISCRRLYRKIAIQSFNENPTIEEMTMNLLK